MTRSQDADPEGRLAELRKMAAAGDSWARGVLDLYDARGAAGRAIRATREYALLERFVGWLERQLERIAL